MSSTILDKVVEKCRKPGSFNAHRVVRHLQHFGANAQQCFTDNFNYLATQFVENRDEVDNFCDVWACSRNPETIIWVIKAAVAMRHTFLLETMREILYDLVNDVNLTEQEHREVLRLIDLVENEVCPLPKLTENCHHLVIIGAPFFEKYAPRPDDELELKENLFGMAQNPRQNGVALVLGGGGNGKSSIMSNFIFNKANLEFFVIQCNIQVIIWLNCYQWNVKLDRQDLFNKLLELARQGVEGDAWKQWNSVQQMLHYFNNVIKQRILFIFDDCFNGDILTAFRSVAVDSPCCAIARYREMLRKAPVPIVGPSEIKGLADEAIVHMLRDTYGLNKLDNDQLKELARRCVGSPLVASLWAGLFKSDCDEDADEEDNDPKVYFSKLMNDGIKELLHDELPNVLREEERTAYALFRNAIEKLKKPGHLTRFLTFLLVNPVEPIAAEDLEKFWKVSKAEATETVRSFVKFNLVRKTLTARGSDEIEAYLLHQVLHEAAHDRACLEFGTPYTSLASIRIRLLGEYCEAAAAKEQQPQLSTTSAFVHSLNEMVGDKMSHFLEQILTKFRKGDFGTTVNDYISPKIKDLKTSNENRNMLHYVAAAVDDADLTLLVLNSIQLDSSTIDVRQIISQQTADGKTALALAAENGHQSVVEYLYHQWPHSVKIQDRVGQIPLALAAFKGHLNVVEYLYQQWPDSVQQQDRQGRSPFISAAEGGHQSIVEYLYRRWPNAIKMVAKDGRTPLAFAAHWGHPNVVEYLHEQWPDGIKIQDEMGNTPLTSAAWVGHTNVVEMLCQLCPDIVKISDNRGNTSLALAASFGYRDIVEYLYQQWPDAIKAQDKYGKTALAFAAENGHQTVVEYLYQRWHDALQIQDNNGKTPLLLAAENGHADVAAFLSNCERR